MFFRCLVLEVDVVVLLLLLLLHRLGEKLPIYSVNLNGFFRPVLFFFFSLFPFLY